jgi:uncharacterized membrane protein
MVSVSSTSATITSVANRPSVQAALATRVVSVDLLRGLVMVIMALDHTREYFSNLTFPPEDLTHTFGSLFFTRFVTHYCAPVFFLLAGTGAFLAVSRGKQLREVSRFFWTRGLWLVFLELTVIGFGWTFFMPFGLAGVIWELGWSMVAMAVIVRLPIRWIAILGVVMIAGHNLLDAISPDPFGKPPRLWMALHSPGMYWIKEPTRYLYFMYPLIPWVGVMASGYAMGALLQRPDRTKLILRIGVALTLAFFALRGINLYGNGTEGLTPSVGPWSVQPTLTLTVISFFNTLKYPASLDFLLMTLGPALIALAWFDRVKAERGLGRVLLVFGRVPMFYYVLHIYLLHIMAIVVAWTAHQPAAWLWSWDFILQPIPAGYGHGLPLIYLMWITAVVLLYLPCKRYMEFKRQHRDWRWLSYV